MQFTDLLTPELMIGLFAAVHVMVWTLVARTLWQNWKGDY